jgi:SOS-response transcriptional repressor LexA
MPEPRSAETKARAREIKASRTNAVARYDYGSLSGPRRKAIMFIADWADRTNQFPSREQIRQHMQYKHSSSVVNLLMVLSGDGFLRRSYYRGQYTFWLP